MLRMVAVATLAAMVGLAGGCARQESERQVQQEKAPAAPKEGVVGVIKEMKLAEYPSATIGSALDRYAYFDKREWKESDASNGKIYVDFLGWFKTGTLDAAAAKNGVTARGVAAKFVINSDGTFYLAMVSKVESGADGRITAYPLPDKKGVMDAIYANRQVSF